MVSSLEQKLTAYFKKLESCYSDVGFIDPDISYIENNVPTVAYMQEFGDHNGGRRIPPRPFMRKSVSDFSPVMAKALAKSLVENKYDSKKSLDELSIQLRDRIKQNITDWSNPENAEWTIMKKGFNDPLVDTGLMRDSVEYEVKSGLSNES